MPAHGGHELPPEGYQTPRHDLQRPQLPLQQAYPSRHPASYAQYSGEPRYVEPPSPRVHQRHADYPPAPAYDPRNDASRDPHTSADYRHSSLHQQQHQQHQQRSPQYPAEHGVAAPGGRQADGASTHSAHLQYQHQLRQPSHTSRTSLPAYAHGYYSRAGAPAPASDPRTPPEQVQLLQVHSPDHLHGSPPSHHTGYGGSSSQRPFGSRESMGAADHHHHHHHYSAPSAVPAHAMSPQPQPQQPQQHGSGFHRPSGVHSGNGGLSAVPEGLVAESPSFRPARSASRPSAVMQRDGIPVAMAGPSVNDAESTSPKELETTLKRRKRNAESAARLRERRKLREADLQDACAKLESQIAELKKELVHEKHRAKESLKGIKAPETSAAEPAGDANIEQVTTSMGDVVVVGAKRRRNPQDSSNGDASSSAYDPEAAGGFDQPKARPLRELDMVRMSDLRSKIETLGELNQNVCVNLGVLRQEIQRLVNAVIAKKTLAPV